MLYYCAACKLSVVVIDGQVIRACKCAAPVVGSMSAAMQGTGSVKPKG